MLRRQRLRNIYTDTTHANNTQQATPAQPKAQNNIKDTFWRRFLLASLFSKVIFFFMYTGDGGGVFLAWERGVEPGLYVCIYANVLLICC